jgi:hypothetical protein
VSFVFKNYLIFQVFRVEFVNYCGLLTTPRSRDMFTLKYCVVVTDTNWTPLQADDPMSDMSKVSVKNLRALQNVISNALAAAENSNVPEDADLFNQDIQMANNEEAQGSSTSPPDKTVTSSLLAPTAASMESTPSPLPLLALNALTPSPSAPQDMVLDSQETSATTPAASKTAEKEDLTSSGPEISHHVARISPAAGEKSKIVQADTPTEAEVITNMPLSPASASHSLASGNSPSAVPSLDDEEEEKPYDAEESAGEEQSEMSDPFTIPGAKPMWSRRFVGSEGEEQDRNTATLVEDAGSMQTDGAVEKTFGDSLAVPSVARQSRSRSYTSISEEE